MLLWVSLLALAIFDISENVLVIPYLQSFKVQKFKHLLFQFFAASCIYIQNQMLDFMDLLVFNLIKMMAENKCPLVSILRFCHGRC